MSKKDEKEKVNSTVEPNEEAKNQEVEADEAEKEINPLEQLQQDLENMKKRCDNEHELLLRTAAEYDNFRKRSAVEKSAAYQNAQIDAVAALLPVADNLERALEAAKDDNSELKKGVEMTMKQLNDCFAKLGVEVIDAEPNTPFNPDFHNAVMHIEDENLEQNVIVQCFQKGYTLGDRVIRYSMVQVAN